MGLREALLNQFEPVTDEQRAALDDLLNWAPVELTDFCGPDLLLAECHRLFGPDFLTVYRRYAEAPR